MSLEFGIEAFFAPKDQALQLEQDLRKGGVATVKITASGKAALLEVSGFPGGSG